MNLFYLDHDLKSAKVFIFPYIQRHYAIMCSNFYEGQQLLKKLNLKLMKDPLEAPELWTRIEVSEIKVDCYKLKTTAHSTQI